VNAVTPWRDPRTGLTVHRPLQRRTRLKLRSAKQAARERIYGIRRKEYLSQPENQTCAFPLGCTETATTIQHLRGRRGWRLLHEPWWAPSCWSHNAWAEDHTGEALAIGWLHKIEGPA